MTEDERIGSIKYTDLRVDAQRVEFETRLAAMEKAVTLAANTMEKRLDSMNEFREALKDTQGRFLTRQENQLITDKMESDIRVLREDKARLEGKASQAQVYVAWLGEAIAIALSLWVAFGQ